MQHRKDVTTKSCLAGIALASVLTAIPFGLVTARALPPTQTFVIIAFTAIAQVVVYLRYFLRIDLKSSSQNKLAVLGFAAVVLLILVGGTLWVMFDRYYRLT
ncbi:cytochrome o ubiquinol oxidase subunit IV [Nitrobacter sp.]|uniref:cytochrome o ubiquinol oxidase subunit IV n=1 Tax=Nitrobacter sp. TaxID=29420 RepID=UPI003F6547F3